MTKRILAVLLAVCMITGTVTFFASAEPTYKADQTVYGKAGEYFNTYLEGKTYKEIQGLQRLDTDKFDFGAFLKDNYYITSKQNAYAVRPEVTNIDNSNVRNYLNFNPPLDDSAIKVESVVYDPSYTNPSNPMDHWKPSSFSSDATTINIKFSVRNGDKWISVLDMDLADIENPNTTGDNDKYIDMQNEPAIEGIEYTAIGEYSFTWNDGNGAETFENGFVLTLYDVARLPLPVTEEPLPHDPENTFFHFHFKWNLWKNLTDLGKWIWGFLTFVCRTAWEPFRWLLSYVVDITPHF